MRLLITGLRGTLAPRVASAAVWRGWQVLGWDRHQVDPDNTALAEAWLRSQDPGAIVHLATGSAAWAGLLANFAQQLGRPLVQVSTAMVFHHQPDGPHRPQDERNARDDYGRSKMATEDAVRAACPQASIARIGWQIDPTRPGNNMLRALDQWQAQQGQVAASRAWTPACSFMDDTAAALLDLVRQPVAGPVHLDSNADEAHGFDRIVAALQQRFGRHHWQRHVHEDYRHDQRLIGSGQRMPPLSAQLPLK